PPAVSHAVILSLAHGIHVVFLLSVPLTALAFCVTFLLKELALRETAHVGSAYMEGGVEMATVATLEPLEAAIEMDEAPRTNGSRKATVKTVKKKAPVRKPPTKKNGARKRKPTTAKRKPAARRKA